MRRDDRAARRDRARSGPRESDARRLPSHGFADSGLPALHRQALAGGAGLSIESDHCGRRSTWAEANGRGPSRVTGKPPAGAILRTSAARVGTLRARHIVQLLETDQHIARFGAVRRPKDARELELIDDTGGPTVANAHAPLQQRRRSELILDADLGRLPEQGIAFSWSLLRAPC